MMPKLNYGPYYWIEQILQMCMHHLCADKCLSISAVQAEQKTDGLEEFMNAGSKLLLFHAARSP